MTDEDLKRKLNQANETLSEKPKKDENIHTLVLKMILLIIGEILKRLIYKQ